MGCVNSLLVKEKEEFTNVVTGAEQTAVDLGAGMSVRPPGGAEQLLTLGCCRLQSESHDEREARG